MNRADVSRGALVAVGTGLAVLFLAAVVVFAPAGKAPDPPVRSGLFDMMTSGPVGGLWRVETIDSVHTWAVAPAPDDETCVLVARENDAGVLGKARRWSKARAAAFFAPGEEDLFFANYRLVDDPIPEGRAMAAVWIPRHDYGGDTARRVWTDVETGDVVRLEDRSFLGYCIRCMERQTEAPDLSHSEAAAGGGCSTGGDEPPSVARLAAETAFPLLAPTYIPPGFQLVQSGYYSWPVQVEGEDGADGEPRTRHVRMAYLTYSDGLARIALGVAAPADMDAFEESQSRIPHNPDACPALPTAGGSVQTGGVRIRRRYDRCRTVLRLDAMPGVSVSLIARNELPADEYVDVIASVQPVETD